MIKRLVWWFFPSQILVFLLSFIRYHAIGLLQYINISFIIGGILLFISISIFILNTGFFDVTAEGFRRVFNKNKLSKEELDEMRPVSELITFNYKPMFYNALIMLLLMAFALILYYYV
ncbi:hypothetical protein AN964_16740 [Heyndrickxia shackletonii]|uniref:DUF3899 domain-containing protein n=1 Tax=Heyndrickxia shackletonii TaxID=157838 RepID=A0A0Q3WZT5_9BACI|nr:DUF3899 domain-containing protein [Heyndrickxia shackletonii]KQL54987.1 hypothetical protein AN964_16740 [Heyndrickxia shackletonii]NEZ01301.1 DUF3899 domain-containing protein [Heyndrickxia shackletonii]